MKVEAAVISKQSNPQSETSMPNLYYLKPSQAARDQLLLQSLRIPQAKSREAREESWGRCWRDCLRKYVLTGSPLDLLPPHYRDGELVCREGGDYICTTDRMWVYKKWSALRLKLIGEWLTQISEVYEYGCGGGDNLLAFATTPPIRRVVRGYDNSAPAIALVNAIARETGHSNIRGDYGDLLQPPTPEVDKGSSAIITCGALEQVGVLWEPFVSAVLRMRPTLCINVEPILELYDEECSLPDYAAAHYHRARGYLKGFLPGLYRLEENKIIKLLRVSKSTFGSRYHDGFSVVVWRPL